MTLQAKAFGAFVLLTLALWHPGSSGAAVFATECGTPDLGYGGTTDAAIEVNQLQGDEAAHCAAIAERLEQLVAEREADRDRLDLMWWGDWAAVGLLCVLLFSSKWHSAWRFLRE